MKAAILIVVAMCLLACSKEDDMSANETAAITIKSPNVSAEQSRADMEKANIPPEAKKILGGAAKGSQ